MVGRTGSGKSTLLLALYRMFNLEVRVGGGLLPALCPCDVVPASGTRLLPLAEAFSWDAWCAICQSREA